MVKVFKLFGLMIFFILSLIFFMPKVNLYYKLEQVLQQQNIIISNEKLNDNGFNLEIKDATVFFDSLESAKIEHLDISTLILYQSLNIQNIKLSGIASSFIPISIENISIKHMIINPLNITISANGEFGTLNGSLHIIDKNLHITLKLSKQMLKRYKKTLKYLEKNKNGDYNYDTIFN